MVRRIEEEGAACVKLKEDGLWSPEEGLCGLQAEQRRKGCVGFNLEFPDSQLEVQGTENLFSKLLYPRTV